MPLTPTSPTGPIGSGGGETPRVSVLIPAYNAAPWIAESIGSVLAQTFTDIELIVVDDGSTDGTGDIVKTFKDPRVRLIQKPNRGTVSDARNAGLEAARAPLIAFLDADDAWLPEKLARQVPLFEQPDVVLVYCAYALTDADLIARTVIRLDPSTPVMRRWLLLEGNGVAPSTTTIVRREAALAAGPYRLELSVSEDLDFAERVARLGRIDAAEECLALYRCHERQGHRDLDRFRHDVEWILADRFGVEGAIDRRSWSRGTANLATRLAAYELHQRRTREAARQLVRALRLRPMSLLQLPTSALLRRARRRLWTRHEPVVASNRGR